MSKTFLGRLKRFFFAGLAALLPTILTIGVLVFCWNVLNEHVAGNIDAVISALLGRDVPAWVGLLLAFFLVLVVGVLFTGYLGRQLLRLAEAGIKRIPVVKTIYPYAKQVTEFFFEGRRPMQFTSAVALEYPRHGVYSIGFVMNEDFAELSKHAGEPVVVVFMPSSPTPITGYTVVVPRKDVIPLQLTVDEAFRFAVSGGVLLPPNQLRAPAPSSG